jgi:periplasmic divalent cation tolerance protein
VEQIVLVVTTVDDRAVADALATGAVAGRHAACAQVVGPVASTYWWQGRVESASEWQVQLKTTAGRAGELVDHLRAEHPYDVPEVVVTPVVGGNPDYAAWVVRETDPDQSASQSSSVR